MIYRERLTPGAGFFIALLLILPAMYAAFAAINSTLAYVLAFASYVVVAACAVLLSPTIGVTTTHLFAGRATIERSAVGEVRVFDGAEATAERGPLLDARAYLCIRGALPVVRAEIVDSDDPTPYWLISTRHPEELARALAH